RTFGRLSQEARHQARCRAHRAAREVEDARQSGGVTENGERGVGGAHRNLILPRLLEEGCLEGDQVLSARWVAMEGKVHAARIVTERTLLAPPSLRGRPFRGAVFLPCRQPVRGLVPQRAPPCAISPRSSRP